MYFGESPGDDLLATAVVRQWRRTHGSRVAYLTKYPELFTGNDDVAFTASYDPLLAGAFQLFGVTRLRLAYHTYDAAADRTVGPPGVHVINLMCDSANLPRLADPAPLFCFAAGERPARAASPRLVVQSSVMAARFPSRNKEWFPERMQQVVDALSTEAEIVQIGATSDPPLASVTDMRGRTSVRESAAILAGAWGFIGLIGFPMHLARAVGTPSVIVFGGREHPREAGYPVNRNLFTEMHCSPCWFVNHCPYDRECMRRITAEEVIAEARTLIRRL
jgi:hypothetical protein